jgi:hypothetical protein
MQKICQHDVLFFPPLQIQYHPEIPEVEARKNPQEAIVFYMANIQYCPKADKDCPGVDIFSLRTKRKPKRSIWHILC